VNRVLDVISGQEHERGADFVIAYQGELISGVVTPGDDADAVDWFTREDLPPIAFAATQRILDLQIK
jgi:hypothetical protein